MPLAPPSLDWLAGCTAILALVLAAWCDLFSRTIPNRFAATVGLCGLVLRLMDGQLPLGLLVAGMVFAAALLLWRLGLMGGGDVKLFGACALVLPPAAVLPTLLDIALAGGVLALLYLAGRRVAPRPGPARPRLRLARHVRTELWRIRRGGPLPYGCAIAAGTILAILGRTLHPVAGG